ncbi:MAG: tyrosine-type recombinase/integrase [Terriglobales bacterium]|jgi:integrase
MSTPLITIFVRHSRGCKYAGDEFCKRCNCRKHLRWTQGGKQYRKTAGSRSWEGAEEAKGRLVAQLSGLPVPESTEGFAIQEAISLFKADKENQGVSPAVNGKYARELDRFLKFCEHRSVFTVQMITRGLLIAYATSWPELYPSTMTRAQVQARLKHFLRFCQESGWMPRVPKMTPIRVDEPPTMPLTAKEYERLLETIQQTFGQKHFPKDKPAKVRALVQLMRWTGLAIRDAVTLERGEIQFDKSAKLHCIVTVRQKTGTHVSVPLKPEVAEELLAVLNGNPKFVFWSGNGLESSTVTHWQDDMRTLFKASGIRSDGHMRSHRLRDTFAVDLLEKGVPLEEVSKLLGHESIKTTERSYAKWVKGRQDRLNSLVTATWVRD